MTRRNDAYGWKIVTAECLLKFLRAGTRCSLLSFATERHHFHSLTRDSWGFIPERGVVHDTVESRNEAPRRGARNFLSTLSSPIWRTCHTVCDAGATLSLAFFFHNASVHVCITAAGPRRLSNVCRASTLRQVFSSSRHMYLDASARRTPVRSLRNNVDLVTASLHWDWLVPATGYYFIFDNNPAVRSDVMRRPRRFITHLYSSRFTCAKGKDENDGVTRSFLTMLNDVERR